MPATLASIYANEGALLMKKHQLNGAEKAYIQAIQQNPRSADLRYQLAMVSLAKNDMARTSQMLQESLRLNPGYAAAKFQLQRIAAMEPLAKPRKIERLPAHVTKTKKKNHGK